MSLKHGLLGLLNYGSMTGYELDRAFRDSLDFFWQAKTSQVYRELDTMEKSGWLTSERVIQSEKPNKRVYTITDKGKEELTKWLLMSEADIADAMRTKSAFLMRIFFAGESSDEQALEALRAYRRRCLEEAQKMSAAWEAMPQYETWVNDAGKTRYWKIAAMYGDTYFRAGIEWADKAIALLEEGQT
jgi:DNA-binding PadR family transcriptional regulator